MSGPVSVGGLGSGIDTTSLINQLMQIEQQPLALLQKKKQTLDDQNTAFQALNLRIAGLQAAANDLTLDLNLRAKTATSTDSSTVSASAGSGAPVGSYQIRVDQLATATSVTSKSAIGNPITSSSVALSSLNFSSAVTAGSFTLQYTNGGTTQSAKITVDPTQSLSTLATTVASQTGGHVTLALDNNAASATYGKLVLTADNTTTSMVLGANGDTSNFLTVSNLAGGTFSNAAGGGTVASKYGIGVTQLNATIDGSYNASVTSNAPYLQTKITSTTTGAFTINGVQITYDTSKDSINSILGKINSSSAGVTAVYNAIDDKVTLTSRTTGSGAISLADNTGNFLGAIGVADSRAQVTNGQNALIGVVGVNGFTSSTVGTGSDVSSATNDFQNVVPGIKFTAVKPNSTLQTITVAADNTTVMNKVNAFVAQYNQTVDAITAATAKGQPNAFDSDLSMIMDHVRSVIDTPVAGISGHPSSLADLGITTTYADPNHLTMDQTKFMNALNANPDQVAQIFNLTKPDPTNSTKTIKYGVASVLSDYLTSVGGPGGVFSDRNKSTSAQDRQYDQQILDMQDRLSQYRTTLTKEFTAMDQAVQTLHDQQNAFLSQLGSLS